MSTDLDDLLRDASAEPDAPDVDRLWGAGRRRRRLLQGGAVLSALALIALVGVAVAGLDAVRTPTVEPVGAPDDDAVEDVVESPEPVEVEEPEEPQEPAEPAEEPEDDARAAEEPEEVAEPEPDPGPRPDEAAMADPCAAHQGGGMEAFIDVVSPVDGQRAAGSVELVGCARVYEGTVRYRLLDADGAVLRDDFTTATAGGPELGEFRETISFDATGELTLEVFWDSPATGEGERDTQTVAFEAA